MAGSNAPQAARPLVALLAVPEATASTVYGMYDLFASAGRDWEWVMHGRPGRPLLEPRIVAASPGGFRAGNGAWIEPDCTLTDCPRPAVLIVPEVMLAPGSALAGRYPAEIAWLQRGYAGGALLAAACTGALLFAEAGLLDDREATIHWAYCDTLAHQYPRVRVHRERTLVATGPGERLIMAGGGTTWLDLALYLVGRLVGFEEAMRLARLYLIDWHQAGQKPFAALSCSRQSDDAVIARCQQWLGEHYDVHAPVAGAQALSGLAERSFKRRFRAATGMAPMEYVHTLRLEEAKQMLEASDQSVECIAAEVGYEDASFFGRLFKRRVGLTPAQYRRRFRHLRQTLGGHRPGAFAARPPQAGMPPSP